MLSQTGISLLAVILILIFYYCFTRLTRQKAPWNFTIISDGNVKGYSRKTRDFLQEHANGDASDKKLTDDDETLLDPSPQDKRIIVFCEIAARMEGMQESAILRLANHYKKNIMVFYITSGQREFEISNCEARQKNLNNSDVDERALKDALSDFLELSPFQQSKSVILRALIITIIVTFLFMLMPTLSASDNWPQDLKGLFGFNDIVEKGYASLDTELEGRRMVLQNISNLEKEMQKYERLLVRQNNRTDNLEKKVQQKYEHLQEVIGQQNIKFDNLEKEMEKYKHLQENNTQLKTQINRLEKELQKYEHLQETNTKINDIEKKYKHLPEENTRLKNSLNEIEEQMRFLNKQFTVISKQLEDREQEIRTMKKRHESLHVYLRKFFNVVSQSIPQTYYYY